MSIRLRFFGESFDPFKITQALGVEPTAVFRKGDPIRSPAPQGVEVATRPRDGWLLKVGPKDTFEIQELLANLRQSISAEPSLIRDVCRDLNVEACVIVGVVQPTSASSPILEFRPDFHQWLSEIRGTLTVDVILSGPPESPQPEDES